MWLHAINGENLEEIWLWKSKNYHFRQRKKNQSHLDEQEWERQTTKPIPYNFGMLFNNGKNIACLQNGFKICHA